MDVGQWVLDGNADAVEFCPNDSLQNVLAVSTYVLQEGDQPSRSGSISLFDVDADKGNLGLIHKVETSGVFDIKWSPNMSVNGGQGQPLLAQADADGRAKIYTLETNETIRVNEICDKTISSSSMCLCIDWSPSCTSMAIGLSDGSVAIASLGSSQLQIERKWKAHEFELWAASFDVQQPNLVYTGSDDCKFSCWDLRDEPSNLVFQDKKAHKMGICSIAKSPHDSNVLLTGSYDEFLRVWDVRSTSKPLNEFSLALGGGVWRIKHHPFVKGLVLTACMHNGFAIVKYEGDKAEVIEAYNEHSSLAYGADWQRGDGFGDDRKRRAVATCSFYDRLLRVWVPRFDL